MAIKDNSSPFEAQHARATGTSTSTAGTTSFPVIDHNHPLYLQPTDTPEKVNIVVLSWIMNSVRPDLLSSVLYASDVHKVWEDLKERFDKVNGFRVLYLHKEIHTLTQGTMIVTDYFTKLKDLWDEFDALMPCPGCPCP
ncbi:uncharacterized protein [Nicotiana tomentosiformis]|uniref:uncharacterized protein n=1 Tax=Nicotiana tomentosiformis TaxID=4098 RepID=UPI00388C4F8D